MREARDANLAAKRKITNEALRKQKKEEARVTMERREEKVRNEAEWNALYGDARVQEEGHGNDEGWDSDNFM